MSRPDEAGRFARRAVTAEEARRRVLAHAAPLGAERVPLASCYGRRAAEAVRMEAPVPHFRRSGMDGYAVRAADTASASTASPVELPVVGSIACGDAASSALTPGAAMRIMTGAMVPEGADAVVMLEATEEAASADGRPRIRLKRPAASGANVGEVGSDSPAGAPIVARGDWLGPTEIALLATAGFEEAVVYRRPRVALLATGSELLPPSAPLEPGKIRNSNAYMLAAQALSAGAEPVLIGSVPDSLEALRDAVTDAMAACDVVVTTGGVSVGDYDVVAELLGAWDGELLFHKVQMRPGSVTSAAVRDGKLLLGLSGNPGACFAGFELFVRTVLRAMQGDPSPSPLELPAELAEPFPKTNAYPRYVRGRCWRDGGRLVASAAADDKSSRLLPGLGADCFVVIPPGGAGLPAGASVTVILLRENRIG
ncbi:molybdopterin molybdotransferase MoeA [Paenibacillus sp. TRM 82003]|nr:molybdopterin molybdotransferase MoeA [Paenibacillus sp. TRM 82003]